MFEGLLGVKWLIHRPHLWRGYHPGSRLNLSTFACFLLLEFPRSPFLLDSEEVLASLRLKEVIGFLLPVLFICWFQTHTSDALCIQLVGQQLLGNDLVDRRFFAVNQVHEGHLLEKIVAFQLFVEVAFDVVEHGVLYVEAARGNQLTQLGEGRLLARVPLELVLIAELYPLIQLFKSARVVIRQ